MKTKRYEGFSLIEILVVVALIIILATITLVAINPGKNFEDARNAQRSSDVNSILNAVTHYTTKGGALTALGTIATCEDEPNGTPIGTATGNADLTLLTTEEHDYIVSIPIDPKAGDAANTGYTICTIGTRVQIAAPGAEGDRAGKIIVRR